MSKGESDEIYRQLGALASQGPIGSAAQDIKLCYVTVYTINEDDHATY